MKKTLILLSIGLVALASCAKQEGVEFNLTNAPAWVSNEELPVPIEFGGGISTMAVTKGTALSGEAFAASTYKYDILAAKSDGTAMPGFENGLLVSNQTHTIQGGDDDGEDILTVNFGGSRFYPYLSTGGNAYNFYGYGIDGTHHAVANGMVTGIVIGNNDIIWAKSEPDAAKLAALSDAIGKEVPDGFNARYMRAAYKASLDGENLNETLYYSYLPKLTFAHITSQIQFLVRAEDEYAANSLSNGGVRVQSITVKSISLAATLNVTTGALAGGNVGNLAVSGIPAQGVLPQYVVEESVPVAAECGEPVFILPVDDISLDIVISMPEGSPNTTETITLTDIVPKVGGTATTFQAGKKYNMTIVFQSIEEIKVVTELLPWDELDVDDIILE